MTTEYYPVKLAATYKREWDDGFGARGWKLDDSIDDPMVIASTADTGDRIPTSVFVHDILDHHLCGLPLSGHRNEAIALTLLGERTGTSPRPDFKQMTEEDILRGNVNGEKMRHFLPAKLVEKVPAKYRNDDKLLTGFLLGLLGEDRLEKNIIDHFETLGREGYPAAVRTWKTSGLNPDRRSRIGLAIQRLLDILDRLLQTDNYSRLHGYFCLADAACAFYSDDGRYTLGPIPVDPSDPPH